MTLLLTKFGKEYTALDGALVFTMLPFRNVNTNILIADMESILPRDEWTSDHNSFCLAVGATLDVKCVDEANEDALAVAQYWEETKNATTSEKWELYRLYISQPADLAWWEAYQATKRKSFVPAPSILQGGEPNDPNSESSGGTNTAIQSLTPPEQ